MNPYTSVITSMEGELQELDQRRAKLIAALGSLRALDGSPVEPPTPAVPAPAATRPASSHRSSTRRAAVVPETLTVRQDAIVEAVRKAGSIAPSVLAAQCGYDTTSALRHHLTPLLSAGLVIQRGKTSALRFSLPAPPSTTPRTVAPMFGGGMGGKDSDLETVWDGSKGSPSLTSGVAGMGSSLSGTQYEVGRRLR